MQQEQKKKAAFFAQVSGTYSADEAAALLARFSQSPTVIEALAHLQNNGMLAPGTDAGGVIDKIEASGKWGGYNIGKMREALVGGEYY